MAGRAVPSSHIVQTENIDPTKQGEFFGRVTDEVLQDHGLVRESLLLDQMKHLIEFRLSFIGPAPVIVLCQFFEKASLPGKAVSRKTQRIQPPVRHTIPSFAGPLIAGLKSFKNPKTGSVSEFVGFPNSKRFKNPIMKIMQRLGAACTDGRKHESRNKAIGRVKAHTRRLIEKLAGVNTAGGKGMGTCVEMLRGYVFRVVVSTRSRAEIPVSTWLGELLADRHGHRACVQRELSAP